MGQEEHSSGHEGVACFFHSLEFACGRQIRLWTWSDYSLSLNFQNEAISNIIVKMYSSTHINSNQHYELAALE